MEYHPNIATSSSSIAPQAPVKKTTYPLAQNGPTSATTSLRRSIPLVLPIGQNQVESIPTNGDLNNVTIIPISNGNYVHIGASGTRSSTLHSMESINDNHPVNLSVHKDSSEIENLEASGATTSLKRIIPIVLPIGQNQVESIATNGDQNNVTIIPMSNGQNQVESIPINGDLNNVTIIPMSNRNYASTGAIPKGSRKMKIMDANLDFGSIGTFEKSDYSPLKSCTGSGNNNRYGSILIDFMSFVH